MELTTTEFTEEEEATLRGEGELLTCGVGTEGITMFIDVMDGTSCSV